MTTVADSLAQSLLAAGTDTVFGLPGGENVEVVDALDRAGIRFVLVRNESSAVYMADTYGRVQGVPGAALTTLGPGAMNAMAGAGHAWLDRSPVALITARTAESYGPIHTHQVLDLSTLFSAVAKESLVLLPETVAELPRCLARLRDGRPGPVHIQVSNEAAARPIPARQPEAATSPDLPPGVDPGARARQVLQGSRRPLLVVGLGMEPRRPYPQLQRLAESLAAPVLVTPKAKGAISDRHPLSGGTIGLTRTDPAYELLDEADCVVAIGFDVVELVKLWDFQGALIWVAPWQNRDPIVPSQVELVGDLAVLLTDLAAAPVVPDPAWGAARVGELRHKLGRRDRPAPGANRVSPQAVLQSLRGVAGDDVMVTVDVGSHKIFFSLEWPTYAPNSFFVSNGLSSMGFGLAGALGAALAAPERPVVCITGDGGMSMVLGELGLLAELNANVTVVVMNDGALDLIRSAQRRAGKPARGTEFGHNPDFVAAAHAFGIPGRRADGKTDLSAMFREALESPGPALIEVMVDPAGYPTTPRSVPSVPS